MARVRFDPTERLVEFRCPCGWTHIMNLDPALGRPCWTFNGDVERPTITPSINAWGEFGPDGDRRVKRCHSWVTDGRIQFLDDCTHPLAGQTVDLPQITPPKETTP